MANFRKYVVTNFSNSTFGSQSSATFGEANMTHADGATQYAGR